MKNVYKTSRHILHDVAGKILSVTGMIGGTGETNHNSLDGLQGGAEAQFYHLDESLYTALTTPPTNSQYFGTNEFGTTGYHDFVDAAEHWWVNWFIDSYSTMATFYSGDSFWIDVKVSLDGSIIVASDSNEGIKLDGDTADPGNGYYYGTNKVGAKGWTLGIILPMGHGDFHYQLCGAQDDLTQDALLYAPPPAGDNGNNTLAGLHSVQSWSYKQTFATPSASTASINLPHGVAPDTPVNGDIWTTTTGVFAQVNGITIDLTAFGESSGGGWVDVASTPAATQVAVWDDVNTIGGYDGLTFDGSTLSVSGDILLANVGNKLAFGDGDTYMAWVEESDDDFLYFYILGTVHYSMTNTQFSRQGTGSTGYWTLLNETGTNTNPNICPSKGDYDTGIGYGGSDTMCFIANSTEIERITSTGILVDHIGELTGSHNIVFGNTLATSGNIFSFKMAGLGNFIYYNEDTGQNLRFGTYAGNDTMTGTGNVLLGRGAGLGITTGNAHVCIGLNAMAYSQGGNYSVVIGNNAFAESTTVSYNVAVGYRAGRYNWGTYNVFVGYQSGYGTTGGGSTGSYNIAVGANALYALTTGTYNVAWGYNTLVELTTQTNNTAIGGYAGRYNVGTANTFIGTNAGTGTTGGGSTGSYNQGIGGAALQALTSGSHNHASGTESFRLITTQSFNTGVGNYSGRYNVGSDNVFFGYNAGKGIDGGSSTGSYNVGIGSNSLASLTTGAENFAMGYNTLVELSTTSYNTVVGAQAGRYNVGAMNVFFGHSAGMGVTGGGSTGQYNVFQGYESGKALTTGEENVGIGFRTLMEVTTTGLNMALGSQAGRFNVGQHNVFLGASAGKGVTGGGSSGGYNIFIGSTAGLALTTGTLNVAIGYASLVEATTTGYNTCVGYYSGRYNVGNSNTFIGGNCGTGVTGGGSNGEGNVALGAGAASNLTTGDYNLIIGAAVQPADPAGVKQFRLGYSTTYLLEGSMVAASEWVGTTYIFKADHIAEYTGSHTITFDNAVTMSSTLYVGGTADTISYWHSHRNTTRDTQLQGLQLQATGDATVTYPIQNSPTIRMVSKSYDTDDAAEKSHIAHFYLGAVSAATTYGFFAWKNEMIGSVADTTDLMKLDQYGVLSVNHISQLTGGHGVVVDSSFGVTGTTQMVGFFDAGSTDPAINTRLNYNGAFYAYNFYAIVEFTVSTSLTDFSRLSNTYLQIVANSTAITSLNPTAANDATGLAYTFDTKNNLTNPSAKIVTFMTGGFERFYITGLGSVYMLSLTSDDTEDHVLAIDDSTGLVSKRSVASLGTGVSPVDDILNWVSDSDGDRYEPYTTQTTGAFDTSSTNPAHTTRLNYDGYFYAYNLYAASTIYAGISTTDYSKVTSTDITIRANNTDRMVFTPSVTDGEGATAYKFDTHNALADSEAWLIKIYNQAAEKVAIRYDGLFKTVGKIQQFPSGSLRTDFDPGVANSGTAIAYTFDSYNTLSTAGAKLASFKNNNTEKFYIGYAGDVESIEFKITSVGGYAIKLTAGEALYEGEIVYINQAGSDINVVKAPTSNEMPIGVVFANASSSASVWVVVAGKAYVLPESGVTASIGYVIYTSASEAGRGAQASAVPVAATHFREIGHFLAAGTGNGNKTLAVLHFN